MYTLYVYIFPSYFNRTYSTFMLPCVFRSQIPAAAVIGCRDWSPLPLYVAGRGQRGRLCVEGEGLFSCCCSHQPATAAAPHACFSLWIVRNVFEDGWSGVDAYTVGQGKRDSSRGEVVESQRALQHMQRWRAAGPRKNWSPKSGLGRAKWRRATGRRAPAQMPEQGQEATQGAGGRSRRQWCEETVLHLHRGSCGPEVLLLDSVQRHQTAGSR